MGKTYEIAVIGGDGTGPEVTAEAIKVLKAVSEIDGIPYDLTDFDYGGERYLRTGEVLPDGAVEQLREFDAIYLGAVGHPDVAPGILEKQLLLELRFQLDQYINLRPVKLYPGVETPLADKEPKDIDFVVVRENTEDLYCGVEFEAGKPQTGELINYINGLESDRKIKTILPKREICVEGDTHLSLISGEHPMKVNAIHTQAVDRLGQGLRVSARDTGGMIQAVERVRDPFALGVQWHPEHLFYAHRQRAIFRALVAAADAYRAERNQTKAMRGELASP